MSFPRRLPILALVLVPASAFAQSPNQVPASGERQVMEAQPSPDTLRYVEVVDGTVLGGWSTWQETEDTWGYSSDRQYHFARTERLTLDGDGLPVRLETTGRISDGVPWYERFVHEDTLARWFTPRERGEAAVHGPVLYASIYPAHDVGVAARALLRQPSRTLPLLPEGTARLEPLEEQVVTADGQTRRVRLFAVHGIELMPEYVWLDEEDVTFADEWSVREGWEEAFQGLRATVTRAIADHQRQVAGAVAPSERTRPLVIRGARLFEPETGAVTEGTTIVIQGERIAAVHPDGSVAIPPGAAVIEAQGRMALPGLWDAHAHLRVPATSNQVFARGSAPLHLAAGVTTVRDVGSHVPSLVALRDAIESGEAVGPRVVGAGFLYDADQKDVIGFSVGTPEETRAAVDRYAALDFRQIKLHLLGSELARVAIARAKEHGMGVTGHLPDDMTSQDAIEAGYDVMMHLWWILWTIPWTNAESLAQGEHWESWHQVLANRTPESEPVRAFVALLAERGVAVDPTIGYFLSESSPPEFISDAVDRFPAPVARRLRHKVWQPNYFPRSPLARPARERAVNNVRGLLPVLHAAGVPILPGSDTWAGFGLQYELEMYVEAGIPAPEVLRLATLGAARVMGMDGELGSVAPGKLADLILVEGDPTMNIGDIRRVVTVVKGGRVYDPAAIYGALNIQPCCPDRLSEGGGGDP